MAEYRDEKETLRRRVAALEARLEALGADDREDARTIAELREQIDALRAERDGLLEENAALQKSLRRTHAVATTRWDDLRPRLRRALFVLAGLAGASATILVGLEAPDWTAFVAIGVAALCASVAVAAIADSPDPTLDPEVARERVEQAEREIALEQRKRRRKTRARVEVEKQNVSVEATRRRGKQRKRR